MLTSVINLCRFSITVCGRKQEVDETCYLYILQVFLHRVLPKQHELDFEKLGF